MQAKLIELHRSAALLVAHRTVRRRRSSACARLRARIRSWRSCTTRSARCCCARRATRRQQPHSARRARLQPDNADIPMALATTWLRARDYEQAMTPCRGRRGARRSRISRRRARAAHTIAARVGARAVRRGGRDAPRRGRAARRTPRSRCRSSCAGGCSTRKRATRTRAQALEDALAESRESGRPIEDLHASLRRRAGAARSLRRRGGALPRGVARVPAQHPHLLEPGDAVPRRRTATATWSR